MASSTDWGLIKTEYITGEISLRDLAEKHEVSFSTLGKLAVDEDWNELRKQWRNNLATELQNKLAESRINEAYTALQVMDSIIARFMETLDTKKITAFDVIQAAKFREVLKGGVSDRTGKEELRDLGITDEDIDEVVRQLEGLERRGTSK